MKDPWNEYFIPETKVLRNRIDRGPEHPYGTPDPERLRAAEELLSSIRLAELADRPDLFRAETYEDMKALHRHIFQDVYDWAGEERQGPLRPLRMTKEWADVVSFSPGEPNAPTVAYAYVPADYISEGARLQYAQLERENFLRGLGKEEFVAKLAEHWAEINAIHAFREGNTRTQFAFFTILCARAGYELDPRPFGPAGALREEFIGARFYYQAETRSDRLAGVLAKGIQRSGNHDHRAQLLEMLRANFPGPRMAAETSPAEPESRARSSYHYGAERGREGGDR